MNHAWTEHQMSTQRLRGIAEQLKGEVSGITIADGKPNERDQAVGNGVAAIVLAADHIDRLERREIPRIMQLQTMAIVEPKRNAVGDVLEQQIDLLGLDTTGQLWLYVWGDDEKPEQIQGWVPLPSGRGSTSEPDETTQ